MGTCPRRAPSSPSGCASPTAGRSRRTSIPAKSTSPLFRAHSGWACDKFDEAALKEMPVGGFHAIPKRVHHYGMAKGQTIIQLHGVGPWGITYLNPADDPSKKAAEK